MTQFVLKATITIVIALMAVSLARRSRASVRHGVLSAMFVLLLLLPFSSMLMPTVEVPVSASSAPVQRAVITLVPAPAAVASPAVAPELSERFLAVDFVLLARTAYAAGVSLLLLSLAAGVWRLRSWAARGEVWLDGTRLATELGCADGARAAVLVVLSHDVSVPMTFGFRRQTIVLPADAKSWDADSLHRALCHELEHVRRGDWAMQLVARLTVALYWPHPLVWLALRRFCVEAERACDDAVVRSFEPSAYASQLVALARSLDGRIRVPALAMASPTRLTERVRAILDATQPRGPQSRSATIVTYGAMICGLVVFGSLQLVAQTASGKPEPRASEAVSDGVAGGVIDGVQEGVDGDDDESYQDIVVAASKRGNIRLLTTLLDDGLDVNRSWDGDGTPLLIAARAGKTEAVRFLLGRGADPNVPSPGDGNPLIAAATHGRLEIARLLLDRGARIDDVVPGDENALIGASEQGDSEIVKLLISRGADVNMGVWTEFGDERKREWRTPIGMAKKGRHDQVVRILTEAGARE